jgi:hypothetical protein
MKGRIGALRMSDRLVVEYAPYSLADGVTEERLIAASDAFQRDFLAHQPGFVRRETLKGQNGRWTDLVYWSSKEAVEKAVAAVEGNAACTAFFKLLHFNPQQDPGADVLYFECVREYRLAG